MQRVEWCRDVDWGTAPQWATVVVAVLVGAFSIWGIITARGSYKKSVKDTHEAQARLVYARLVKVDFIKKGASIYDTPGGTIVGMRILDDHGDVIMETEQDRAYFTLGVVNMSKELIGRVWIDIVDSGTKQPNDLVQTFVDVVDPEGTYEYTMGVPDTWSGSYSLTPRVRFRDSGGANWVRIGSDPVDEVITLRWWQWIKKLRGE